MFAPTQLISVALTGLVLVTETLAQANHVSNKATLFDGLSGINKTGLFKAYPATAVTNKVKRAWGTVPQFCYQAANPSNAESGGKYCNPYDIETYEVTFADCDATWQLCRCNNGPWTYDDMINVFSRVPVQARQYTRTLAVFADSGTSAYAWNQNVCIFDTSAKNGIDLTLIFHENGHCVDGGSGGLSSQQAFVDAINKDKCVPDGYAKSNDVEDWAQLNVLSNLDLSKTGPLSKYAKPACLSNQLKHVETTLGTNRILPGGRCTFQYTKDPYVCMGPSAGCGRAGTVVSSAASAQKVSNGLPAANAPQWGPHHDDWSQLHA